MQTIELNIDDSIFDRFMGLLEILPKDKIKIEKSKYTAISFEEAQTKVKKAINNISPTSGTPLNEVISDIINR